jgi:hypothetical protein
MILCCRETEEEQVLLFHLVTTMEGRKSGWLLEVASNIDDCSLMVRIW